MNKLKVYIASPYTVGDTAINVKFQIDVANELMDLGFTPHVPLYSHFQHMVHPRPYEDWIALDYEWIDACDCLVRLGGKSPGGDLEVIYAKNIGIPVFYSIQDLVDYYDINE